MSIVILGLMTLLIAAPSAMATFSNEQEFATASYTKPFEGGVLSERFIFAKGPGKYISAAEFATGPLGAYYRSKGFSRNFLAWAPISQVSDPALLNRNWAGCNARHATGTICTGGERFRFSPADDFDGPATVKIHQSTGSFIGTACGNFPQFGDRRDAPVPRLLGRKIHDLDGDGVTDPGEPGLDGVTIKLYRDDTLVDETTTGADGGYSFRLDADANAAFGGGRYTVEEVLEGGRLQSGPNPAAIDVPWADGGQTYRFQDLRNYVPPEIEVIKTSDDNNNGIADPQEEGLPDWLFDFSDGHVATTGADGRSVVNVDPGTVTITERPQDQWQASSPTSRTLNVSSGDRRTVRFTNVCEGSASVTLRDATTGTLLNDAEVRLEELDVTGVVKNTGLPATSNGEFSGLMPGTYRVIVFLPEDVYTPDKDAVVVDGRWAIVKEIEITACQDTALQVEVITGSEGKITGVGLKHDVPGGFATSGFQFQVSPKGKPRGTLQYNDHASGLKLHTKDIRSIWVSEDRTQAIVWGFVDYDGEEVLFRLCMTDAGEPGRDDSYALEIGDRYAVGQDTTINAGNIQIHKK